ncbi:MAG TPA: hypothetical protein ENH15_03440 [Actinobacteria bacterium]|nr:hypothetical protein [Actinomycetota bacterium]
MSWQAVVDDLEGLVVAWRAVAEGESDIEITELPRLPSGQPDPETAGQLIALHAEMMVVESELASARDLTAESIAELRTIKTAADKYLRA